MSSGECPGCDGGGVGDIDGSPCGICKGRRRKPSEPPPRLTIAELAARVAQTSVDKGFIPPTWGAADGAGSNYLSKLMLVHTEIDEAIEAIETGTIDENIPGEFADIAIRLLSILVHCHESDVEDAYFLPARLCPLFEYPQEVFGPIRKKLRRAAEAWRLDNEVEARSYIKGALHLTCLLASTLGVDLYAAIVAKDEKNRARPLRHGKKALG